MSSSQPTSPSAGSSQPPLPKLPKVLSIIANATNCQWQEAEKVYAAQVAMTEEESAQSQSDAKKPRTDQAKSMSASLARLRKQMSTLRLLDGSLLCQLMSLNAALSEYRAQEERFLSENSDIIIIEDEDDFEEDSSELDDDSEAIMMELSAPDVYV